MFWETEPPNSLENIAGRYHQKYCMSETQKSDVDETVELLEPDFMQHVDSAGMYTSGWVFFSILGSTVVSFIKIIPSSLDHTHFDKDTDTDSGIALYP